MNRIFIRIVSSHIHIFTTHYLLSRQGDEPVTRESCLRTTPGRSGRRVRACAWNSQGAARNIERTTGTAGRMERTVASNSAGEDCTGGTVLAWYQRPRVLYFSQFFLFAAINSRFNSIFFMYKGMSESQIGVILSIHQLMGIFVNPAWTIVADACANTIKLVFVCSFGACASFLLYSAANTFGWILIVRILFSCFFPPIASLLDAFALQSFKSHTVGGETASGKYGLERLWGAVSWAIAHTLIGVSMDASPLGPSVILIFAVVNMIIFAVTVKSFLRLQPRAAIAVDTVTDTVAPSRFKRLEMWKPKSIMSIMFRNKLTIAFFLDIMVMGMAVSLVEGLVFLFFVRDMKASFTLCGLSVVVTVLFEIPIFAMAPKITKRFSHQTLLLIAHVAYIVRVVGYTFLPNPWLVLFLEPLHGVTYACFQISTVVYCSELAPDTMQATAQGLRSATLNIGSLIGYTLGSYVMENYGSVAMYRGSACLVFVTLCGCIIAVRTFSSSVNTYRETE